MTDQVTEHDCETAVELGPVDRIVVESPGTATVVAHGVGRRTERRDDRREDRGDRRR
jgi:hypothetical protein